MWNVQQPEAAREEQELDEVCYEEAVVRQELLGKELGPCLHLLLLNLLEEGFDCSHSCQVKEQHIR